VFSLDISTYTQKRCQCNICWGRMMKFNQNDLETHSAEVKNCRMLVKTAPKILWIVDQSSFWMKGTGPV
jgi:hypothetical protein